MKRLTFSSLRQIARCILVFIALSIILGFSAPGSAQVHSQTGSAASLIPSFSANQIVDFEQLNQIGGPVDGLAIQGQYAYVAIGTQFAVIDISNPRIPSRVSYLTLTGRAVGVTLSGSYAYVFGQGLWTVDISEPLHPRETSFQEDSWVSYCNGQAVSGYMYLQDCDASLFIYNLTDPAVPALFSTHGIGT